MNLQGIIDVSRFFLYVQYFVDLCGMVILKYGNQIIIANAKQKSISSRNNLFD
ncbi:MAG: hypothetical protein ACP5F6_07865 [Microbacter sp.]